MIGCWTLHVVACVDRCYDVSHQQSHFNHLAPSSLLVPNQVALSHMTSLDPMENSSTKLAKYMLFNVKSLTKYGIWLCPTFIHTVNTSKCLFPYTELNKNYIHLWACRNTTYEKMFHRDVTMELESIRILFHVITHSYDIYLFIQMVGLRLFSVCTKDIMKDLASQVTKCLQLL